MSETLITYEGEIHQRPISRGIVLKELGEDGTYLDQVLAEALGGDYSASSGARFRGRITIERFDVKEPPEGGSS